MISFFLSGFSCVKSWKLLWITYCLRALSAQALFKQNSLSSTLNSSPTVSGGLHKLVLSVHWGKHLGSSRLSQLLPVDDQPLVPLQGDQVVHWRRPGSDVNIWNKKFGITGELLIFTVNAFSGERWAGSQRGDRGGWELRLNPSCIQWSNNFKIPIKIRIFGIMLWEHCSYQRWSRCRSYQGILCVPITLRYAYKFMI